MEIRSDEWAGAKGEHRWWPRTLWLDPGGTTGLAVVWFHPKRFMDPENYSLTRCIVAWDALNLVGPEQDQELRILEFIRDVGGEQGLSVGAESFVVRQLNMSNEFLSPVRVKAVISFQLYRGLKEWDGVVRRRRLYEQTPADAKSTVTDQRLRLWNMYKKGPPHARDATRHALLHLRRVRGRNQFKEVFGWDSEWDTL